MNENALVELNKLVDDILAGHRTVIFPPGILYVAISIVLLLVASVFFMGGSLSLFASTFTVEQTATAQLVSVAPHVTLCCSPLLYAFSR
ncbi:MAG: hypothetical protein QM500_01105 [Methylococcales bacterium]